ncbi:MAG TPA: hypothetical protein VG650_16325 [Mycobacteriales bacterium]|nr:hypothetical protein [Mycobacteriales bacterium]
MTLGLAVAGSGVAAAVSVGATRIAHAAHPGTRVNDRAEAWYATPSGGVCLPVVGCLPLPVPAPSVYPAGTLHVAVTLGSESARAYVVPALPEPASRRIPSAGMLLLPVDSSPLAGTVDLGSAHIKACLTTGKLPPNASARGATAGAPPAVDCKVHSPATYSAETKQFRVDLSRFLAKWRRGTPNRGVALLANTAGASPLVNWHVALDGTGSSGPTVHSLVSFAGCHGCDRPQPTGRPMPAKPIASAKALPPPPSPVAVPAPIASPQVAVPAATSAVYLVRGKNFRYPAIFGAPLAILAGVIFFSRLFTGSSVRTRNRLAMGADNSDG